eukprot:scaffold78552_cov42-Phaeocystis_antarctica.AAC.1
MQVLPPLDAVEIVRGAEALARAARRALDVDEGRALSADPALVGLEADPLLRLALVGGARLGRRRGGRRHGAGLALLRTSLLLRRRGLACARARALRALRAVRALLTRARAAARTGTRARLRRAWGAGAAAGTVGSATCARVGARRIGRIGRRRRRADGARRAARRHAGVGATEEGRFGAADLGAGSLVLLAQSVHAPAAAALAVAARGRAVLVSAHLLARAEVATVRQRARGQRLAEPASPHAARLGARALCLVHHAPRSGHGGRAARPHAARAGCDR